MAGVASNIPEDKMRALDFMKVFERESVGSNTGATRRFLEEVYTRQKASMERTGSALEVDWIGVSEEMGQHIVNFGL